MGVLFDKFKRNIGFLSENWARENIYNFRKGDGVAYLALYILIPVIITIVSLSEIAINDDISIIYCYITILISALNSIYDGANRWKSNIKSVHNTKLFIILGADAVIVIYCIILVLYMLISKNFGYRKDAVLLVYFLAVAVSFFDIAACFFKDMSLQYCIEKSED